MATTATSSSSRDKTLIEIPDEIKFGLHKWWASVRGADGLIYGIPCNANRVVRFDPATKTLTPIGMDLRDYGEFKWPCGVLAGNGFVYSAPSNAKKILKIDTRAGANADTAVSTIDLPDWVETIGYSWKWSSGDKSTKDECLYFMPYNSSHILRIDPNDNDLVTRVGNDLGNDRGKFSGTVATPDGCIYGIPAHSKQIIKFDPANPDATTTVGQDAENNFYCVHGGVLAADGNIYALTKKLGGILKIDVANDTHSMIKVDLIAENKNDEYAWSAPIKGRDDRLYFPPYTKSTRAMVFDTTTQEASLVGPRYSDSSNQKWRSGALAPDGKIYCLPFHAKHILEMDPSVFRGIVFVL